MDMSDNDEFASKKKDPVNTPVDWRISVSNPTILYPPENPISQMLDPFRQNLWHDDGFNVHTDAATSSSFRGNNNIDRPLEMGWNMAQFPSDSGFIERAVKFSFLGCGSISDMMMNQQSSGVQDSQIESGNGLLKDASKVVRDRSNELMSNVLVDSQSSGGNGHDYSKCWETSSKGFNTKKRKRIGKDSEPDQSLRTQQSGEEEEEKQQKQKDEQSPKSGGYIHMRARKGQATNSHSLAERVRREKISERMKFLQDLVPGCDKVTGKAVMLDEIINYVQSLQCQIEFLSMKLSTVNPTIDCNLESLLPKDALQVSAPTFPQNMSMFYPPLWYLSQTGFIQPNLSSMSSLNGLLKRQETHGYESDHNNVVHMNHKTGTAADHEVTKGEMDI